MKVRSNNEINRMINSGEINSGLSGRNLLINGGFDIWQRGDSFIDPVASFLADRWSSRSTVDVGGTKRVASNSFYTEKHMLIEYTNATSYDYLIQNVEGKKVAGENCTYSLQVYIDTACDFRATFKTFEAGVETGAIQSPTTTVNETGKWVDISWTLVMPAATSSLLASDDYMQVFLKIAGDGTDTIGTNKVRFRRVKLEQGSVATPFETVPIADTLARCQRYYAEFSQQQALLQRLLGGNTTGYAVVNFTQEMRITPIVGDITVSNGTPSLWASAYATGFTVQSSGMDTLGYLSGWTADAEL